MRLGLLAKGGTAEQPACLGLRLLRLSERRAGPEGAAPKQSASGLRSIGGWFLAKEIAEGWLLLRLGSLLGLLRVTKQSGAASSPEQTGTRLLLLSWLRISEHCKGKVVQYICR